ncbi:MAG: metal-dependent hydrolase [Methanobacterium sp.]|jgi:inner membrane protein|nr:metal-dependent hydrolase [Methanobacterium sp.]
MRSYTHIVAAILLFVVFAFVADFNNLLTGIFFAGWISVFPDIIDKLTGKHRGIGHSIFWLIPLAIVGFWNIGIAVAMMIGFISHIFLDILTTNGCPVLYPLWKNDFVCFGKKKRIKTGTNEDKSVLLVMLLLLIPFLFLTTDVISLFGNTGDENVVFAGSSESVNSSIKNDTMKNNFYLNFELKEGVNKNISIQKVSEKKNKHFSK